MPQPTRPTSQKPAPVLDLKKRSAPAKCLEFDVSVDATSVQVDPPSYEARPGGRQKKTEEKRGGPFRVFTPAEVHEKKAEIDRKPGFQQTPASAGVTNRHDVVLQVGWLVSLQAKARSFAGWVASSPLRGVRRLYHRFRTRLIALGVKRPERAAAYTLLGIFAVGGFILLNQPHKASAGWWDDTWHYRKSFTVTKTVGLESNVYISITIDTSVAGRYQADCGDLRFTTATGDVLPYFIVSGCGGASTVTHIFFESLPVSVQTVYYYYGNPSAANGFASADFSTVATNYSVSGVGSEESGTSPIAYWSFDEGSGTRSMTRWGGSQMRGW